MKNFIEVLLTNNSPVTIAIDKIVYITETQHNNAVVFLQGPVSTGTGVTLTLKMSYADFIAKLPG